MQVCGVLTLLGEHYIIKLPKAADFFPRLQLDFKAEQVSFMVWASDGTQVPIPDPKDKRETYTCRSISKCIFMGLTSPETCAVVYISNTSCEEFR